MVLYTSHENSQIKFAFLQIMDDASKDRKYLKKLLSDRGQLETQMFLQLQSSNYPINNIPSFPERLLIQPMTKDLLPSPSPGHRIETKQPNIGFLKETERIPLTPSRSKQSPPRLSQSKSADMIRVVDDRVSPGSSEQEPLFASFRDLPPHLICAACGTYISHKHYHCDVCDNGNFDLCVQCQNTGEHCGNISHLLGRRTFKQGEIVNCIGQKPQRKVVSASRPPQREAPRIKLEASQQRDESTKCTIKNRLPSSSRLRPTPSQANGEKRWSMNGPQEYVSRGLIMDRANCQETEMKARSGRRDRHVVLNDYL
jgi:hypothetical protein